MGVILDVSDLHIEFHDHEKPETVVHDFDLMLEEGEIVGLVGESGSGKSMSAMAIAGLLSRHEISKEGKILYNGTNLLTCSREELRSYQGKDIAMIFQEPMTSLNPSKRIGWQVEESVRIHRSDIDAKTRKEMAVTQLSRAGLPDPEKVYMQYPHELSGGMRQRVMIAAAMILNPRILIADEPTTALDVMVQAQIIDLLREINREYHTSIIFISHDLSLVNQLCHRVLVMHHGRVVEAGRTREIFRNPQKEYTMKLIGSIPKVRLDDVPPDRQEMAGDILSVRGLTVSYQSGGGLFRKKQENLVLKGIDLTLHRGEILALVGESGCGKSTLAKAVTGMNSRYSGSIELSGDRPQMVFQDPYSALNPSHTIGWLLEEPLRIRGGMTDADRNARVLEMMDMVRLDRELIHRYPGQLSGGQRQRICIAAALMLKPEILLADEPVSALDVTIQVEILALLKRLRAEMGLSILFISHDLRTVYQLCDTVAIMKGGVIIEKGPVNRIYREPEQAYTRQLLKAAGIAVPGAAV